MQPLIDEFEDVFSMDLPPGVPLIRETEYPIDFLHDAFLSNKSAYQCNSEETKELNNKLMG